MRAIHDGDGNIRFVLVGFSRYFVAISPCQCWQFLFNCRLATAVVVGSLNLIPVVVVLIYFSSFTQTRCIMCMYPVLGSTACRTCCLEFPAFSVILRACAEPRWASARSGEVPLVWNTVVMNVPYQVYWNAQLLPLVVYLLACTPRSHWGAHSLLRLLLLLLLLLCWRQRWWWWWRPADGNMMMVW